MLLILGVVILNAQEPEYCQEFDNTPTSNTAFLDGNYPNWINVSGKVGDKYDSNGNNPLITGIAFMELKYASFEEGTCRPEPYASESIAYQIPGKFIKGRRYKIEYKIGNVARNVAIQQNGNVTDALVEVFLVNDLVNEGEQLNACYGQDNSVQTLIDIPDSNDELESYHLEYLEEDVRILDFKPTKDYDSLWFRCKVAKYETAYEGPRTIEANIILDYFKVYCGNERYENINGELVNENGEEKEVFCLGESICIDATTNNNYVRYRYGWTERDQFGNPISWAETEIFNGLITDVFCLDDYDWAPNAPWGGGWCPDRNYSISLSLINECGCWTNLEIPFTVECCDEFFDSNIVGCPDDCLPESDGKKPVGLCFKDGTFSWDEIPGAVEYTLEIILNDTICCDNGKNIIRGERTITDNSIHLPFLSNDCFSWTVTVLFDDGDTATSDTKCSFDPCVGCEECDIVMSEFILGADGCPAFINISPAESETCDLSYSLDWGDGSGPIDASTGSWISYNYAGSGVYTVCVTVTGVNAEGEECSEDFCEDLEIFCGKPLSDNRSRGNSKNTLNDFAIIPNPVSAEIGIQLTGSWGNELSVEIYNAQGKLFKNETLDVNNVLGFYELNIQDMPFGTYLMHLRDELGNFKSQKLFKL